MHQLAQLLNAVVESFLMLVLSSLPHLTHMCVCVLSSFNAAKFLIIRMLVRYGCG